MGAFGGETFFFLEKLLKLLCRFLLSFVIKVFYETKRTKQKKFIDV